MYIRVAIRGTFPCSSSQYCAQIKSLRALLGEQYSQTELEPQGGEHMSAELVAHKPHCSNRNLLQLFALVLCAPLPTRRKLRFHLCNSCISLLVFVVCEPCVRSTRMRGILLRSATQAK